MVAGSDFWGLAVEDATIALVLTYLLSQISRMVSKILFENKYKFQTVEFLLPSSVELSSDLKGKIYSKVSNDFQVTLPTMEEEASATDATRRKISEAISLIIDKVANGRLTLQHNIEYGFVRNLTGGSAIAVVASIFNCAFFGWVKPNENALVASLTLAGLYLLPIVFAKPVLKFYSKQYAQILFREYIRSH